MKSVRHEAIKEIVRAKRVSTQKQLVLELRKKGIEVTQATLSRDLGDLGLQKSKDRKEKFYTMPQAMIVGDREQHARGIVKRFVYDTVQAGNLVIAKTAPGAAPSVGASLDSVNWVEILGTVAGDDTVLILTKNAAHGSKISKRLKEMQGGPRR